MVDTDQRASVDIQAPRWREEGIRPDPNDSTAYDFPAAPDPTFTESFSDPATRDVSRMGQPLDQAAQQYNAAMVAEVVPLKRSDLVEPSAREPLVSLGEVARETTVNALKAGAVGGGAVAAALFGINALADAAIGAQFDAGALSMKAAAATTALGAAYGLGQSLVVAPAQRLFERIHERFPSIDLNKAARISAEWAAESAVYGGMLAGTVATIMSGAAMREVVLGTAIGAACAGTAGAVWGNIREWLRDRE